ncbi:hypothetical protein ACVW0Q_000773 [Thermostichus sp. MS-CIW-21]|jgi:hypothetical protein
MDVLPLAIACSGPAVSLGTLSYWFRNRTCSFGLLRLSSSASFPGGLRAVGQPFSGCGKTWDLANNFINWSKWLIAIALQRPEPPL